MGKCKICGTEIADTEEMCEDCKALDDVDLIKSDDELEALLNSVMHSHTSYSKNGGDTYVSSDEKTFDSDKDIDDEYDPDEVSAQLDNITNDLLEQYNMQEEEPLSIDSVASEEEEPLSIDSVASEEEEPLSIDSVTSEEEEPLSIDSVTSEEEEPLSIDSVASEEEEPLSIDSLTNEEEEPFSIDSVASEEEESATEEALTTDSLMPEKESGATSEDIDLPVSELHNEETPQVDNDLYASIPGFEGIFEGIDDDDKEVSDVGDIFADVLGTVSNYGSDEENLGSESKNSEKKSSKKEKKSFFKGLFENIENEETEKEFLREKELAEAKAAQKASKKEQKAANAANKKVKKEEAKKRKQAAKASRQAAKAEKAKKLAEEEQDHSKINKKGATVVLVAFAALCAFVIFGTNTFAYSLSIKQAQDYLARKKYTKAYNEISGVDIKEDDQLLANKIKTIMYVNKEYDSYNNYYAIQYYAEALNSLLNGLTKYDVYLDEASELGVKSDLQYVKSQILEELQEKYNLDEEDAKKITSVEDQEKYSDKVFEIAEKLVKNNKK